MKETPAKRALIAAATIAATISLAACSTSANDAAPTTTAASASAPTTSQASGCEVNPASAPLPTAERYDAAPADSRISVALSGIPSGTIKPGDPPAEVELTLCNNSPVDYPKVGVVVVLTQCTCATTPIGLPKGTADRFDPATGNWIPVKHPVTTTGADYLGAFSDVLDLPKGKTVTLRYRVALDGSMTDGKGGVEATVVVPDSLVQIGKAHLPFTVSKESTAPPNGPRPTVLPFEGLGRPGGLAVNAAGDVYITDVDGDRVLKLAVGSNEPTVLPFTGLHSPGRIAVDAAGNVYVSDFVTESTDFAHVPDQRVVKLAAGSNEQSVLPVTPPGSVQRLAADAAGNVFVASFDKGDTTVVKLAAGSNDQTVLPFEGIKSANAIAVDGTGNVYVNDGPNNRVVKLAADSTSQTALPLAGLESPDGLAVGTAGDVYVIDGKERQVVKFAAGSSTGTVVPSTGLYSPDEVAVDGAGNVYVIDHTGFGQVMKLAAG
jgi:sugar lactone lactonase YvrE